MPHIACGIISDRAIMFYSARSTTSEREVSGILPYRGVGYRDKKVTDYLGSKTNPRVFNSVCSGRHHPRVCVHSGRDVPPCSVRPPLPCARSLRRPPPRLVCSDRPLLLTPFVLSVHPPPPCVEAFRGTLYSEASGESFTLRHTPHCDLTPGVSRNSWCSNPQVRPECILLPRPTRRVGLRTVEFFVFGYYISSVRLVFMTGSHGGCSDPDGSVEYCLVGTSNP